jgi:hypothetical protein
MVRIRQQSGAVIPVDGRSAIEIVDGSGNLGVVVIQQANGAISILTPGDPLFNAHLIVTGQRASHVVVHEPAAPVKNGKPFELVKR